MTEKVGLELSINTQQANAALDKTRASALSMGGALEKVDRASAAAAKGIGALGPAMGTLSRSSSETLRGLGDIAGLIGTGGALGIGLGLAAVAVSKVADAWTASERAAKAAAEEAVRSARTITEAIRTSIEEIEIAKTKAETGITDTAEARARMLRVELSGLNYQIKQLELTAPQGVLGKLFSDSDNKLDAAREKAKALAEELAKIDAALADKRSASLGAPRTAPAAPAPRGGGGGGSLAALAAIGYGDESALPESAFAIAGPSAESTQALADARLEVARVEAEQRVRIAREAHDQMLADDKAASDAMIATQREQTATYAAVVGGVATLTGSLAAGIIAGQESAWASFLSGAASQAGQFITLEGAKTLAVGVGGALVGNPAAPAQIAGGIALMAAGSAIATGGAAAAQQLAGGGGRAGGGGGAVSARREVGVNRGRSSGGNGTNNGPTVINVTYSAAGPRPEDTGRAVNTALQAHRRRTGRIG
jgi:hypothetical protein